MEDLISAGSFVLLVSALLALVERRGRRSQTTVLVADDDPHVRGYIAFILRSHGYRVFEARDGEEGLRVYLGAPVDLTIADLHMPRIDGSGLGRQITAFRPDAKVVYISGASDTHSLLRETREEGSRFLSKPFTGGALLSAVRETLSAAAAT